MDGNNIKTPLTENQCDCDETLVDGVRVDKPKWHDCEYIRRRGKYVFSNCLIADRAVEGMPDKSVEEKARRNAKWMATFNRHMDYDGEKVKREMAEEENPANREATIRVV